MSGDGQVIKYDLDQRFIVLYGTIDADSASELIVVLHNLERSDPRKEIDLYISSDGGNADDFLAIYDTIQCLRPPVNTIALGRALSAGAMILLSGTGRRLAYPNARIMLHQLSSGIYGTMADMTVYHNELLRMQETLEEIIAKHTGQPVSKVRADIQRDYWMGAQEALEYGIIDSIIVPSRHPVLI